MIKKIKTILKNIHTLYFTVPMFPPEKYVDITSFIPFSYDRCLHKQCELRILGYDSYIIDKWYGYKVVL